jgi:hypothetical protein
LRDCYCEALPRLSRPSTAGRFVRCPCYCHRSGPAAGTCAQSDRDCRMALDAARTESQPVVIRGADKGLVQWFESASFTHTAMSSTLILVRKRGSQDHRSLRFRGREAGPRRTAMARSRPPRTCPASGQTCSPRTVIVPGRRNRPLRTYGGSLRNRGPLMIDGRALLIAEAL